MTATRRTRRRARTAGLGVAALLGLVMLGTQPLAAQGLWFTTMTIDGFPLTNTGPSLADFDAGSVALGSTSINVNLTLNLFGGGFSPRVTTVRVRCNTPCPASGTLPAAGLAWRRADLGTWNTLSTTFVDVETRTAVFGGTNDPWTNSIFWRYSLSYAGTPPTAATQFNVQFQLQVTAP